ncbi:WXG100 family type VII secretion target [Streptomyces sp. NPDC089799]|uniref:WXG100 family type VII secretion target n=1 Tax=Streptomyces sp. NPDC089799 TaxID=3155066 RepID=UPI00342CEC65
MAVHNPDLAMPEDDGLVRLADDLDAMQRHLDDQVRRMDGIVDRIQARWRGTTGDAFRALHLKAAEDAVRIREHLRLLEEAVRLGRDGFDSQDLEVLEQMRRVQAEIDVAREAAALQAPPAGAAPGADGPAAPAAGPRSRVEDL